MIFMREYQYFNTVDVTPEDVSNNENYTANAKSLSPQEVYNRLINNGQLDAIHEVNRSTMNKKQAELLLNSARIAPKYMQDGHLYDLTEMMSKTSATMKKHSDAAQEAARVAAIEQKAIEKYKLDNFISD